MRSERDPIDQLVSDVKRKVMDALKSKAITMVDLAKRAGPSRQQIYGFLNQPRGRPSLHTVGRLAAVVGHRIGLLRADESDDDERRVVLIVNDRDFLLELARSGSPERLAKRWDVPIAIVTKRLAMVRGRHRRPLGRDLAQ